MRIFLLFGMFFVSYHQVYSITDHLLITGIVECADDRDCHSDYYCLSSHCEHCIPCEKILNREKPSSPTGEIICARNSSECGVCLPGFTRFELTGSTDYVPSFECIKSLGYESDLVTDLNFPIPVIICFLVLTTLVVILSSIAGYRSRLKEQRKKISARSQQAIPDEPPPYTELVCMMIVEDELTSIPRPPPYSVIDSGLLSDDRRHASYFNRSRIQETNMNLDDSDPVFVHT